MSLRSRRLLVASAAVLTLAAAVSVLFAWSPASLYRLTGRQRPFNAAVSQGVPKGATLARLERVVGAGQRVPVPAWLRRTIQRQPGSFPDGWREGDTCMAYPFPGRSTWYFQVRDGRLVNYDPAVLAGQPQEHIALR